MLVLGGDLKELDQLPERLSQGEVPTDESAVLITAAWKELKRREENSPSNARKKKNRRKPVLEVRPLSKIELATIAMVSKHKGNIAAAARELKKDRATVAENFNRANAKLPTSKGRSANTKSHLPFNRRGQEEIEDPKEQRR